MLANIQISGKQQYDLKIVFFFLSGEGEKKGREEGLAEGEKKGREEGLAEGEKKGRREGEMERSIAIARNLLAQGVAIETISQCVGLSIEELNAIK